MISENLLEVHNLGKSFRTHHRGDSLWETFRSVFARRYIERQVLHDLTFDVGAGEVLGLVGLNGAGKTTAIKILSGVLHPDTGQVRVLGENPWNKSRKLRMSSALIMGQRFQANPDLTAYDSFRFFGIMYDLTPEEIRHRAGFLAELLGMNQDDLTKQVRRLSLGQKMKVELILSFLHFPRIAYLDEPTLGLDCISQSAVRDFLKSYVVEKKAAIVLTSHYFKDIEELSNRLFLLHKGRCLFYGQTDALRECLPRSARVFVKLLSPLLEEDLVELGIIMPSGNCDGRVFEYEFVCSCDSVSNLISRLVHKYGISEISIEEDDLESIVRRLYERDV